MNLITDEIFLNSEKNPHCGVNSQYPDNEGIQYYLIYFLKYSVRANIVR